MFILGVLTPTALFFFLGPLFFFAGLREAATKGDLTCGMPALAAAIVFLFGMIVQLVIALIVQVVLLYKAAR